jgi:hypothetical protein
VIASIGLAMRAASLASLIVSLLFGVGQCAVGTVLVARGLRAGRWRRLALYAAAILGAWFVCSGVSELIVSGLALVSAWWGVPSPTALAHARSVADGALLVASGALALALLLYPLWLRLRPAPPRVDHLREEQGTP